jgi:hypothetical protein
MRRVFVFGVGVWLLSGAAFSAQLVDMGRCVQLLQDMQLYKAGKGDQATETLNGTKLGLRLCVVAGLVPKGIVESFVGPDPG